MPLPYPLNPLGISVREELPLTLTAVEASTVQLTATGSPTVSGLHYRLGTSGPWLPYTIGTVIPLAAGKKVQFWNSATTLSRSNNLVQFVMDGKISGSGNMQSMLNYSDICPNYCFWALFSFCSALIRPPDLTAKVINDACYGDMFRGTKIVHSPKVFAQNSDFNSCLSTFRDCLDLVDIPNFRFSVFAGRFLRGAFQGCISLRSVKLAASIVEDRGLELAFDGCSALSNIEVDFTTWGTFGTEFLNWVRGVSTTGTFVKPAALPEEYGPSRIPTGWTVINK